METELTLFFAKLWGAFFLVFGSLSFITGQLGRTIEMTDDKAFVISTGYTSFLLGLVTVILHNVWVWDWPVVITILAWSTMIKGIMKIGFPEQIHKKAQGFKKNQWLSGGALIVLGAWLLYTGLTVQSQETLAGTAFRDGEYLGYIHAVDSTDFVLAFDDAVWLNGKSGEDAAIKAGHCTEDTRYECLPNGYFIQNTDVRDERIAIDRAVEITMQTWKMEETGEVTAREIGFADFAGLISDPALHWSKLPFTITVQGGTVVRVDEVYIP